MIVINLIICIDNNHGIAFNNRRQSSDKQVLERIYNKFLKGTNNFLISRRYSDDLLKDIPHSLVEVSEINSSYGDNIYYFSELDSPEYILKYCNKIICYIWDKTYPVDTIWVLPTKEFNLCSSDSFMGNSHDCILELIYERK